LLDWTETQSADFNIDVFQPLFDALTNVAGKAKTFAEWEALWYNQVYGTGGFETQGLTLQRVQHLDRLVGFESDLLDLARGEEKGEHGVR
jgi:N-acetylated-alpha-linked acidic dipeptidase